jgi:hypothetical protein
LAIALANGVCRAQAPASSGEPDGIIAAVERQASRSDQPEHTRLRLLERIRFSPACYPGDLTPEQLDQLLAATQLLPPGSNGGFAPRFLTDNSAWTGAGQIGQSNSSHSAQLTYSFPDDGVTWGLTCSGFTAGPNDLNAHLISAFGSIDRGREMIRSAIAAWRTVGALTYTEVADDNSPEDTNISHVTTRGDIRIGGWGFSPAGTSPLAYNAFPNSQISQCNGGDMTLNTNYFTSAYFLSVGSVSNPNNFLFFRNTVCHEHGHGLGFYHTVPCNSTKLMEPTINTVVNLVTPDEIRAAIRDYGDRFNTAGNHTSTTAKDFGNLTTPNLRSVIQRDLGVNGTPISEEDWFKFTIDTPQAVTISAAPTGYAPIGACCVGTSCTITAQPACTSGTWFIATSCGSGPCNTVACCTGSAACSIVAYGTCSGTFVQGGTCNSFSCVNPATTPTCQGGTSDQACCQGNQTTGCSGGNGLVNAQMAGNLALELRNNSGNSVLLSSNSNNLGVVESVTSPSLPAGTYWVRIWDAGGGVGWNANNQIVQTYDLTIRVGTGKAPPMVIAGLQSKRVQSDTTCQFIGNHNSYATEPGATLPSANYAWDLDGDGTFETTSQTQPQITYRSNYTYNVTLRVTDSNGMASTDTIQVTVYGATTTITSTNPNGGVQGSTVPITIIGSNFKGVTSASQVTVSGSGVTVTGTPVINALGTRITGLSFVITASAAATSRDVTVTNSDAMGASGTGTAVFTVSVPVSNGACCAANGTCTTTTQAACTSSFQGVGSICSPNPCPQPSVACCATDGSCTFVTAAQCTSGTAQGFGSVCSPNPCPQPSVACCAADGGCTYVPVASCSGLALAYGTVCPPNPCPQPTGACCNGAACIVRTAVMCTGPYAHFTSVGTACNAPNDFHTPCCIADFNKDSVINSQDIFDFLNAWFSNDSASDLNGDGVSVQDIFDFLNAWLGGC